jgi:hypothetical protein
LVHRAHTWGELRHRHESKLIRRRVDGREEKVICPHGSSWVLVGKAQGAGTEECGEEKAGDKQGMFHFEATHPLHWKPWMETTTERLSETQLEFYPFLFY